MDWNIHEQKSNAMMRTSITYTHMYCMETKCFNCQSPNSQTPQRHACIIDKSATFWQSAWMRRSSEGPNGAAQMGQLWVGPSMAQMGLSQTSMGPHQPVCWGIPNRFPPTTMTLWLGPHRCLIVGYLVKGWVQRSLKLTTPKVGQNWVNFNATRDTKVHW